MQTLDTLPIKLAVHAVAARPQLLSLRRSQPLKKPPLKRPQPLQKSRPQQRLAPRLVSAVHPMSGYRCATIACVLAAVPNSLLQIVVAKFLHARHRRQRRQQRQRKQVLHALRDIAKAVLPIAFQTPRMLVVCMTVVRLVYLSQVML